MWCFYEMSLYTAYIYTAYIYSTHTRTYSAVYPLEHIPAHTKTHQPTPTHRYVLKNWGVRECVSELLFDCESLKLPLHKFYGITVLTTIIVYVLAIVLPNVFVVMLFVGSTACVLFSYVFPGMLMTVEGEGRRVHGWALIGVGVAFMVLGLQRAIAQAMSGW